jgi:hypothetical protein
MRADTPASSVLDGPSSISRSLLPGFLAHSFKAYSSRGSIGHHGSPLSRAASLSSTGPEGSTPSSSILEELATGKPTRETSEVITTGSAQLTPGLPVPSTTSRAAGSQVAEMPELSAPSQRYVSPSPQSEDLEAPRSLDDHLPSEPHRTTVKANLSIPAFSPLYLHTTVSDTFPASPTTPTLSPSVCYSSSETEPEDGLATTENKELDASPVSPTVKKEEGGLLCQETILERPESLSDDDDVDQFHSPTNTALPTVDTHSATDVRAATPRRTAFLSRLKTRGSTLPPLRTSSPLSTSTSMVNLRRKMSGTLFGRTRRLSIVSNLDAAPRSPPPSPLVIKIYDGSALSAGASGIDDDEVRRLSELAFMA